MKIADRFNGRGGKVIIEDPPEVSAAGPAEPPRAESGRPIPEPLAPGAELIPGYEVVEHLTRGDALDVYEVYSIERDCSCVAKVIRPDRRHVTSIRRLLVHEGRLLQKLQHPHLVRGYGTVTRPELVVLVETLTGHTLDYLIHTERRRLSAVSLAYLGLHLCSAVHYLHGNGYLHLDVKPDNVIVESGIAKLIDLSLARSPGVGPRGAGTPSYLSPEQARGTALSAASDVWGIGVTLYEAAIARSAFGPADDREIAVLDAGGYLQLQRPAASLRRWRRTLPTELTAIVERCLDPDPSRRPTLPELRTILLPVTPHVSHTPRPARASSSSPS
jgi:serine/threonine protein kinase